MISLHDAVEPLEGDRVRLRPAAPADAATVAAILADDGVVDWWQTANPETDATDLIDDAELAFWLIEDAGSPVGIIFGSEETDPQYRHAGIDIALAEAGRGRGLGRDAVHTVARWLIDVRGHHRLTIDPSTANERAIAVYASLGFRSVGTMRAYERWRDGTWHDGLLMDLLAEELIGGVTLVAEEDEANFSTGAVWDAEGNSG